MNIHFKNFFFFFQFWLYEDLLGKGKHNYVQLWKICWVENKIWKFIEKDKSMKPGLIGIIGSNENCFALKGLQHVKTFKIWNDGRNI